MKSNLLNQLIEQVNLYKQITEYSDKEMKNAFYWSSDWRKVKAFVLERDNNECQVCASIGKVTLKHLIVHHIQPLEYVPEKRLDEDNLITVCIQCHNKIHGQEARMQWDDEWW